MAFTPTQHEVAAGGTVTTGFTLTASQTAGGSTTTATDAATSVTATALNYIDGPAYGFGLIIGSSGSDVITAHGAFNTIFSNGGNDIILAGQGNAVVFAAGGNDAITLGGGFNTVSGGDGNDTVTGAGGTGSDTFVVTNAGKGLDLITGFTETNGDVLDLRAALTATTWNHFPGTLANYLKITASGGNTTLAIAPTGSGSGTAVAVLNGSGTLGLSDLLAHHWLLTG